MRVTRAAGVGAGPADRPLGLKDENAASLGCARQFPLRSIWIPSGRIDTSKDASPASRGVTAFHRVLLPRTVPVIRFPGSSSVLLALTLEVFRLAASPPCPKVWWFILSRTSAPLRRPFQAPPLHPKPAASPEHECPNKPSTPNSGLLPWGCPPLQRTRPANRPILARRCPVRRRDRTGSPGSTRKRHPSSAFLTLLRV